MLVFSIQWFRACLSISAFIWAWDTLFVYIFVTCTPQLGHKLLQGRQICCTPDAWHSVDLTLGRQATLPTNPTPAPFLISMPEGTSKEAGLPALGGAL